MERIGSPGPRRAGCSRRSPGRARGSPEGARGSPRPISPSSWAPPSRRSPGSRAAGGLLGSTRFFASRTPSTPTSTSSCSTASPARLGAMRRSVAALVGVLALLAAGWAKLREWARTVGITPTLERGRALHPQAHPRHADPRRPRHQPQLRQRPRGAATRRSSRPARPCSSTSDGIPRARCRCGNPLLEPIYYPHGHVLRLPEELPAAARRASPSASATGSTPTRHRSRAAPRRHPRRRRPRRPSLRRKRRPRTRRRHPERLGVLQPLHRPRRSPYALSISGFSPNTEIQFTLTQNRGVQEQPLRSPPARAAAAAVQLRRRAAAAWSAPTPTTCATPDGRTASADDEPSPRSATRNTGSAWPSFPPPATCCAPRTWPTPATSSRSTSTTWPAPPASRAPTSAASSARASASPPSVSAHPPAGARRRAAADDRPLRRRHLLLRRPAERRLVHHQLHAHLRQLADRLPRGFPPASRLRARPGVRRARLRAARNTARFEKTAGRRGPSIAGDRSIDPRRTR